MRWIYLIILTFNWFANACLKREVENSGYPGAEDSFVHLVMNTAIFVYTLMGIALVFQLFWASGLAWYDPLWILVAAFALAQGTGRLSAALFRRHIIIRHLVNGCLVVCTPFVLAIVFRFCWGG